MKILIYGGGALGLGIASCLLKSREIVDIIARKDTVSSLRRNGLIRTGIFGECRAEPKVFDAYSSLDDVPPLTYDMVLVSTKSYDTQSSAMDIDQHHHLINENTKIILFQNGWGNAEIFASYFPEEQIYNARVITGFYRPDKNHVDITVHADAIHIGSLFIKELPSDLDLLCKLITNGDIPCESTSFIEKDLWSKMLYNCALNPLGAIFNVPYGALGEWEHSRTIMKNIVSEIFHVMEKACYSTHWTRVEDFLVAFYGKMLPPTAKHESSMLQDIRAKKRTEIDALNGQIVSMGKKLDIDTPCNSVIYEMIKFIENRNMTE